MKREEATETPAPTPSRLTTLAPTVPDAIDSAYWTFVHPTRSLWSPPALPLRARHDLWPSVRSASYSTGFSPTAAAARPRRLASRRARKYSIPIGMTETTLIARMMYWNCSLTTDRSAKK